MQEKRVTILAIVYNQAKYIDDFMQSLVNQTYKNIEVIVADDCSTDNSFEKILLWKKQLEKRFDSVKIVQTPQNVGIVKNINNALKYVTGEYFKWIACDDMMLPSATEQLVKELNDNPQYGLVYSNYYTCSEDENYDEFVRQNHVVHKSTVIAEQSRYAQALYENDFIVAPTIMTRWKVIEQLELFDENIGVEDWGTWIEIALNYEIGFLDQVTAGYRIVENSLSRFTMDESGRKRLRNMIENEIKILDKFKGHPQIKPEPGIKACCEQAISVAIDLEADDIIQVIKKYAIQNNISISREMSIKFFLYKIHILKMAQWIKRKMKLETNMIK